MKLYDKKFLIYGNCMIRSFGQPGKLVVNTLKRQQRYMKKIYFELSDFEK